MNVFADDDLEELQRMRESQIQEAKKLHGFVDKMQKEGTLPTNTFQQSIFNKDQKSGDEEDTNIHTIHDNMKKVQETIGVSDESAEEVQNFFMKYFEPVYKKIMKVVQDPYVMSKIMVIAQMGKRKRLIIFQVLLILFLLVFKFHLKANSDGFLQNMKYNLMILVLFWIGSSFIIPLIVYRTAYWEVLSAIYQVW